MGKYPSIRFRDGAAGRRPALRGSRLDVATVITTIRQNNNSVEEAADYLEIPREQIEACLRYYADHRSEIDEWIERTRAIAERERGDYSGILNTGGDLRRRVEGLRREWR